MKKTAAIIARVSTGVQDFQRQINDLTALAESMGYQVPEEYIYSEKLSGFTKMNDREALNQILDKIRTGTAGFTMIFAETVSRIARKPSVGHSFVEDLVELNVPVFIKNMNQSSLNSNGTRNKGFFMQYAMLLEFSQTEAEDNRAKFKSGKIQSIKEGRVFGGEVVIYGYKRGEKLDRKAAKYAVDEKEAKVVKKVFDMYLKGAGCKLIANYLNEKKIPTKLGKQWQMGTITQMLTNTFYYGTPIIKGVSYEGVVPAIISKETFLQAKEIAKERDVNPERNIKYLYLLKDRIFCGYCGAKYVAKFRPKKHSHYMCYKRSSNVEKTTCEACGIGISAIESVVWLMVKAMFGGHQYLKNFDKAVIKTEKEITNLQLQLKAYEKDIETKTSEKKKWQRLFVTDKINEDELNEELGKLNTTIKNCRYKIETITKDIATKKKVLKSNTYANDSMMFENELGTDRVKINEVLKNVLDKVIITSTKTGSMCDTFFVTVYTYGDTKSRTVLFNKKTFQFWGNLVLSLRMKFDENGRIVDKLDKLMKEFMSKTSPKDVDKIPFTRLNTLKENQPV
jgi:site-specific DNA recombinase